MPKFFTRYNPAPKPGLGFKLPSKTQTHFKTEADINHLINRYKNAGTFYDPLSPPRGEKRLPMFEDFTGLPEYQEAQNIVADAAERFAQLPAATRKFFDNDPTLLLAFIQDPANREKAEELGLIAPKQLPQAIPSPAPAKGATDIPGGDPVPPQVDGTKTV